MVYEEADFIMGPPLGREPPKETTKKEQKAKMTSDDTEHNEFTNDFMQDIE